jgi:hypothetical protein
VLAERVAFQVLELEKANKDNVDDVSQAVQKNQQTVDPSLALWKTLTHISDHGTRNTTGQDLSPNEIARKELEHYCNLPEEEQERPPFKEVLGWWSSRVVTEKMPC